MTRQEFEQMTGMFPSAEMYSTIEEIYYEHEDVSKQKFCEVYRENHNGFAEYVQQRCDKKLDEDAKDAQKQIDELMKQISQLKAENARLKSRLDAEQEWKPWTDKHAVPQEKYDELVKDGRMMSDDEARNLVASELGFSPARIKILHETPEYEINRHGSLRQTGKMIDRRPCYNATDWHYVLFEVYASTNAIYELYNGDMTMI